ncbi:hypothetical protein [Ligilactobacillus ruminis]|uniref:Selenium binding protein n=3 Tax=Ligilactobacillus ruminis TaxID=1623 RepID=G2SM66_LIGR2|nr:hypothetical protein [Ligilactobacillus ruminis]AEN77838.1 Hypothetical protein LRC_05400 [Ligilactobacillus ruminis ATCC 27782]KLA46703.1 hypothetical protein LRB_717 [Ligilactobacillus ruminis]SFG38340.1 hypothetical protein SAMN02910432_01145 [Ligilactobacillus ruminis DSM 20403 = NBRC 102161]
MCDKSFTWISLPTENYMLLLGKSLSVFSSNNGFIIENILHTDNSYSWDELTDKESGRLIADVDKTITKKAGPNIAKKFGKIVEMRNRIIHGFRITSTDGEQILATKERGTGRQFYITEEYMRQFIILNCELSDMLHKYRGY